MRMFCYSLSALVNTILSQSFWYFARLRSREIQVNPRNPTEFTKTRKIPWNSVEILSNAYNIFETYLSYWGCLLAVDLQIYLETSSLKCANNVPKLPGINYVVKNWTLAMTLKALLLVHVWSILLLKEQMMTSGRKTLKTLISSTQNRSISCKICPDNNHKIGHFLPIAFHEFVPKNPAKFDFFSCDLAEALMFVVFVYSHEWYPISIIIITNVIIGCVMPVQTRKEILAPSKSTGFMKMKRSENTTLTSQKQSKAHSPHWYLQRREGWLTNAWDTTQD